MLFALLAAALCAAVVRAQPYDVIKQPVVKVVFATPDKTPPTWRSATDFNDRFDVDGGDRTRLRGMQPEFRRVLSARALQYVFTAPTSGGSHTLRLGLIDPDTACAPGTRRVVFSVNGASTAVVDVAAAVGCVTPYYLDVPVELGPSAQVSLSFEQGDSAKPPVIANLRLYVNPPARTPFPTAEDVSLAVDVGPDTAIPGTTTVVPTKRVKVKNAGDIPKEAFKTARQGANFSVAFDIPSGTYDVTLGFAELLDSACVPGARVFTVLVNGKVKAAALDVYAAAKNRCRRSVVVSATSVTVDVLQAKPLIVAFESIAGEAMVNYIGVRASSEQCVPVTDDADIRDDHLAHSVPGTYPPFIDSRGVGFVSVTVDGTSSHTHFYVNNIQGTIKSYRWVNVDTGKVISNKASFTRNFPLGSTRLRLDVVDTICSQDAAETTITVLSSRQPGQYCYYYTGVSTLPVSPSAVDAAQLHPVYSAVFPRLKLDDRQVPFADATFMIRCEFFVEFNTDLKFGPEPSEARINVKTDESGPVRVFRGDDLILDSATSEDSTPFFATAGQIQMFQVLYLRADATRPVKLNFKINGRTPNPAVVSHDKATIVPIINSLSPPSGPREGGTSVRLIGYGLIPPLRVLFGGEPGSVTLVTTGGTNAFANSPPAANPGTVSVVVESASGRRSRALSFEYGGACDPPQFRRTEWRTTTNTIPNVGKPTCVALFSDGRMYLGTREGSVSVVTYAAASNTVSDICSSEVLYDDRFRKADGNLSPRTVLGITFHPGDRVGRPYVSTSTLFWLNQNMIDPGNSRGWANGNVERLKPASAETKARNPRQCLERDSFVVRGLPVGAADHSINELVFDQDGNLLVAVAGLTNAGLPGFRWGGIWESFYSGAVIRARIGQPGYVGDIQYTTPDDATTAVPVSTQYIDLFATGFRNLFSLIMTRDQQFYGIDMGTDCKWGNVSATCSEYNPLLEATRRRKASFPGRVVVEPNTDDAECRYSGERDDKLVHIVQDRWYGHSNLQRAATLGTSYECAWVDPDTGRVAATNQLAAPPYKHRELMLRSPMTGLREYGAGLFCGRMRGNLVIARYKETRSFRIERDPNTGKLDETPIRLTDQGAIRVEENEHGQLLYPRLIRAGVTVLDPIVSARVGLSVVGVAPWRHSKKGRTVLRVGGWGFQRGVKVTVGGRRCKNRKVTANNVLCKMPRWKSGDLLVDVKVVLNGAESTLAKSVLYMNV